MSFDDFKPISIYNFINKIFPNRMVYILPKIISKEQSSFVKGRSIMDNILLVQEFIHNLKSKNRGGNVALKLDMEKAYNRLDWQFLILVLHRFGFSETWIDVLWRSVSNSWFSILINGSPTGFFKSHRGVRQGNPLSATLINIAAEALSRNIIKLGSTRSFNRFFTTSRYPLISHLTYADNFIIFSLGDKCTIRNIRRCWTHMRRHLDSRSAARRYVYSFTTPSALLRGRSSRTVLGSRSLPPFTYLGCQINSWLSRAVLFEPIISKVRRRISRWTKDMLSSGGRLTLLRTILGSTTIHLLAAYLLAACSPPVKVLNEIKRSCNNFLWDRRTGNDRRRWASWSSVARPTAEGGLGIRALRDSMSTHSVKHWWRVRSPNSL